MRLYLFQDDIVKDAWNKDVEVRRLVDYVDVEIIGKRPYNNGYEDLMINVASDGNRTFSCPIEIDYFGGGRWYEDGGKGMWCTAKRLDSFYRYVDAEDNPFTKEQLIKVYGELS